MTNFIIILLLSIVLLIGIFFFKKNIFSIYKENCWAEDLVPKFKAKMLLLRAFIFSYLFLMFVSLFILVGYELDNITILPLVLGLFYILYIGREYDNEGNIRIVNYDKNGNFIYTDIPNCCYPMPQVHK